MRLGIAFCAVILASHAFAQSFPGTSPNPVSKGGTGNSIFTAGAPILGNGTSPLTQGAVTVPYGGTGSTSYSTNVPIYFDGSKFVSATRSGNTTKFATISGILTNGNCVSIDVNNNLTDSGGPCGGGGGSGTVASGSAKGIAYYPGAGTVVGSTNAITGNGVALTGPAGIPGIGYVGGGLIIGQPIMNGQIAPWNAAVNNLVLTQSAGWQNALRNSSFTSKNFFKILTNDQDGNIVPMQIANFTGSISGTTLTVTAVAGGTIQLFQRVQDKVNYTTNGTTAIGNNTLHFPDTTGIVAGMLVDNLTNPKSIQGQLRVSSVTSNTVVLTGNVTSPGVGSGDTVAFGNIKRGTEIVEFLTGTGGTGTYRLRVSQADTSQTVSSESMVSSGGWSIDGVYVIPVGAAGSAVRCSPLEGEVGGWAAGGALQCRPTQNLDDLIFRFVVDSADARRIECSYWTGPPLTCVGSNVLIQPLTWQGYFDFDSGNNAHPYITTKVPCVDGPGFCYDNWANATTDLAPASFPQCTQVGTPFTCLFAYSWLPDGTPAGGGYQVEFHTGAIASGINVNLMGFDLRQTPGVTCNGAAVPCVQTNPGPIEVAEPVSDMLRNRRFTQLIGKGWFTNFFQSSGAIETTQAYARSTTEVRATWPLAVSPRCNVWTLGPKGGTPQCPLPNVYYSWGNTVGDYIFHAQAGQDYPASAISVSGMGMNSIQFSTTHSGMTAGVAGYVSLGANRIDEIMLDSSLIGD